jgi:hypothetical protein
VARVPPSASDHPATWKFDYPVYHPPTRAAWRTWLETHQDDPAGVWVMSWRAASGRTPVPYAAIVEEALCVGWIDSTINVFDDARNLLLVTPRTPRSTWAASNKARIARLEAEGRIGPRGQRAIEVAKANGWWQILDDVEALLEPGPRRITRRGPRRAPGVGWFPALGPQADAVLGPSPRRSMTIGPETSPSVGGLPSQVGEPAVLADVGDRVHDEPVRFDVDDEEVALGGPAAVAGLDESVGRSSRSLPEAPVIR